MFCLSSFAFAVSMSGALKQLRDILPDVSEGELKQLLQSANGSIEMALALHYSAAASDAQAAANKRKERDSDSDSHDSSESPQKKQKTARGSAAASSAASSKAKGKAADATAAKQPSVASFFASPKKKSESKDSKALSTASNSPSTANKLANFFTQSKSTSGIADPKPTGPRFAVLCLSTRCCTDPCWEAGTPVPYVHLARTFYQVEHEKGVQFAVSSASIANWV